MTDGFDEFALKLLAEIRDGLVEGAGIGEVVEAPTFVEEFIPGDGLAGSF